MTVDRIIGAIVGDLIVCAIILAFFRVRFTPRWRRHDRRCGMRFGYRCSCAPDPYPDGFRGFDTIDHCAASAIGNYLRVTIDGDDLRNALDGAGLAIVDQDE